MRRSWIVLLILVTFIWGCPDGVFAGGPSFSGGGGGGTVAEGGTGASTLALNGVLYGNGTSAIGATAIGTAGQLLKVGADPFVPEWTSSISLSALDMGSGTSSVPWVIGSATASNTTEGTAYWETDTDMLTIGDGATGISLDLTANTVITFPTTTSTLATAQSLTPVAGATADFLSTFTGANLYGGTYVTTSDSGDSVLPVMAAGMNFCIIAGGAHEVVVDTNGADGYLLDGVHGAEGANLTSGSTAGEIACFQYYTAADWLITTDGWTAE